MRNPDYIKMCVLFKLLFVTICGVSIEIHAASHVCQTIVIESSENSVKPAAIFQSHMVLQQNTPINIWGRASQGSSVTITLDNDKRIVSADKSGKWMVTFPQRVASSNPIQLKINELVFEDILVGEVWLCSGQSNMVRNLKEAEGGVDAIDKYKGNQIRLFRYEHIPLVAKKGYSPKELARCNVSDFFEATWTLNTPENAAMFSSVAWMFGNVVAENLQVPVGIIQLAVGGSAINNWISPERLKTEPVSATLFTHDWLTNAEVDMGHRNRCKEAFQPVLVSGQPYIIGNTPYRWMCEPGFLFEAGIEPIKHFRFKGVVWYQGETDAITEGSVKRYETFLPSLISDWRANFQNVQLPFILVQLPRYNKSTWPALREIQRRTQQLVSDSYLTVTIDLGEEQDIHPGDKLPIGFRSAILALVNIYRSKTQTTVFPAIDDIYAENTSLIVAFRDTICLGDKFNIPGFEVAYTNNQFGGAQAYYIDEKHIGLKITQKPVSLRYGWQAFPKPVLEIVSTSGFPLGPFTFKNIKTFKNNKL